MGTTESRIMIYEQPGDAATRVAEHLRSAGAAELNDSTAGASSWRLGSRSTFRMFGLSSEASRRNIPVRVDLDSGGDQTRPEQLRVTVSSDPGWYLFQTAKAELAYSERVAQVMSDVQEVAAPDRVE